MKGTLLVLGLAISATGCVVHTPPSRVYVPSSPPQAVVVAPTPAPAQVRMVWVPEWGVYVLEGHDIVYHANAYYAYSGGYWWIARSYAGPWAIVAPPPTVAKLPPGQFHGHGHVRRAYQSHAQVVVVPPQSTSVGTTPPYTSQAPAPRVGQTPAPRVMPQPAQPPAPPAPAALPAQVAVAPTPPVVASAQPQPAQAPTRPAYAPPPPPVVASAPSQAGQTPAPPAQPAPAAQGHAAPPPPVVAKARPHMVWVAEWGVHVLEGHDIVFYENAFYAYSGGHWTISQSHTGPWTVVETPPVVIAKLPPGQLHSHLKNHGGCPPGLAKQGRC